MIWTTKDGTKMKISEMSVSHIENVIRYLKRNPKRKFVFTSDFEMNGDIADFMTENYDNIADGNTSTEELWQDFDEYYKVRSEDRLVLLNVDDSDSTGDTGNDNQVDDDWITIHPDNSGPEILSSPEIEPYPIRNPDGEGNIGGEVEGINPPEGWTPGGIEGGG